MRILQTLNNMLTGTRGTYQRTLTAFVVLWWTSISQLTTVYALMAQMCYRFLLLPKLTLSSLFFIQQSLTTSRLRQISLLFDVGDSTTKLHLCMQLMTFIHLGFILIGSPSSPTNWVKLMEPINNSELLLPGTKRTSNKHMYSQIIWRSSGKTLAISQTIQYLSQLRF
jgi:hypothetical protein